MSRSVFRISLEYAMLDGRKTCVPGFEDSSGGHIIFKTGPYRLKLVGPGSWHFEDKAFDREMCIDHMVEQLKEEIINDAHFSRVLRVIFSDLFDQAKAHCDEYHVGHSLISNTKK